MTPFSDGCPLIEGGSAWLWDDPIIQRISPAKMPFQQKTWRHRKMD
ncbi:MAG: hypothetical protein K0S28_851 [Paucimonas sp.]|nr:hypothetical protein [Paucimonas sp.]